MGDKTFELPKKTQQSMWNMLRMPDSIQAQRSGCATPMLNAQLSGPGGPRTEWCNSDAQ